MTMKMSINRRNLRCPGPQLGFALTDMLFAVGIAGVVIMGALPLLNRAADNVGSKAIADDLKAFKSVAEAHFLANRAAYEAAMTDGTGASVLCKVGVAADGTGGTVANDTTLHTCAIDGTMLRFLNALPSTIQNKNAYGEQWVAIYRQVYNAGVATGGDEAMFVSAAITSGGGAVVANNRRFQNATDAGNSFGGGGGAVPDTDRAVCVAQKSSTTYQACGAGWKVDLSSFISATQLATFANRLPN
jgi:type II secretory pathway pseudopilin PulG